MPFPIPNFHPKLPPEPAAVVQSLVRVDVEWNRPVFKAPPLELHPQSFDATVFAQGLRRLGLSQR